MGEIILIVDSDTIVPEVRLSDFLLIPRFGVDVLPQDCFRDAARELTECPEVAIIQHESGKPLTFFSCYSQASPAVDVMQIAHHYFREWYCALHPAYQQVYLDGMLQMGKWRLLWDTTRSFAGPRSRTPRLRTPRSRRS
jgi:hypothetical protein